MQKSIEIQSRGLTLRGTLHLPDNQKGKIPVIIIFHGFAGNKTGPHFIFVRLSRLLEAKEIATVRFDFGGSGESDGKFKEMTITGELEDAKNILNYVKVQEFTDTGNIGVLGLSMGGAVAGMLAGERKNDIKALCLWAPAGNMGEIAVNDFIGRQNLPKLNDDGFYDVEGLLLGKVFVDDAEKLDIYGKSAVFDKKILIIHGDSDEVVKLDASKRYVEYYGNRSKLIVIEDADHTFNGRIWEDQVIAHTLKFFEF
ncbi:MAG: alpha/beta fold hydrolase [Bacillota bacterium]|nr:alpha/beta fold hydrolase [Bacillota bacterium]